MIESLALGLAFYEWILGCVALYSWIRVATDGAYYYGERRKTAVIATAFATVNILAIELFPSFLKLKGL